MSVRSPGLREILLVAPVLSLIAVAVFGPHVTEGGFYSDDWSNAADYHFSEPPQLLTAAEDFQQGLGARFLLAPAVMLPHAVFGIDHQAHLALAVALGVLAALSFYVLLRTLGLTAVHAGPIAVLALLFPWADSTHLWSVAGMNSIAVIFFFLSVTVAVHGLHLTGRRSFVVHGAAQVLFLLAVFTYEVSLLALFVSILLYVNLAPSRGIAFSRWRADLAVGFVALVAIAILTERSAPSLRELAKSAVLFPLQGTALAGHSVLPVGLPDVVAALAVMGLLVFIAYSSRFSLAKLLHDPELRRWVVIGAAAAAFIGVAHLVFFASGLLPLGQGTENRGNVLAAYGYVVLAFSLIMVTARLVSRGRPAGALSRTSVLGLAAALVVAIGYAVKVREDASAWDRAAGQQAHVLRAVREALPAVPSGSTIYVTGAPLRVSPGIPIFAETWDLRGAVQLEFDDPTLEAYPIDEETTFVCARRSMHPYRPISRYGPDGYGPANGATYGEAVVVDAAAARAEVIEDEISCRAAAKRTNAGHGKLAVASARGSIEI